MCSNNSEARRTDVAHIRELGDLEAQAMVLEIQRLPTPETFLG